MLLEKKKLQVNDLYAPYIIMAKEHVWSFFRIYEKIFGGMWNMCIALLGASQMWYLLKKKLIRA